MKFKAEVKAIGYKKLIYASVINDVYKAYPVSALVSNGYAVRVTADSHALARRVLNRHAFPGRFPTPSHLTTVNAVDDAARREVNSTEAATTRTRQPAVIPKPATRPVFAPPRSELVTRYSRSGPGVRLSSQAATAKSMS